MEGYSISSVLGSLILNLLNIVALFLILRALVYRPVQRFLQARTDRVQVEFDRVAEEKAEAKRLHEAYLDQLSRSKADADAQAAEVLKRAEETVRAMQAQAQTDAEELLSRARQQARREHADAQAQLRRDMADIAVDIAGRVIGREVTEKDNADIIDAYFDAICAEAQGGTGT